MQKYLQLNDVSSYKKSFALSNYVWQFVRAVDSISANIAEGFGRFSKKDKIKFYRYSMDSQKESLDWNEKANARKLITTKQHKQILNELQSLPLEINQLIKFTREKLKE